MVPCARALESKNVHEASEDWFDATERLTGTDFSVTQENITESEDWDPKNPLGLFLRLLILSMFFWEVGYRSILSLFVPILIPKKQEHWPVGGRLLKNR